jgi:hypothetical protein
LRVKIVLASGGRLRLSAPALARLAELKETTIEMIEPGPGHYERYRRKLASGTWEDFHLQSICRDDEAFVSVVEEFGPLAAHDPADLELRVVEIPEGAAWRIFTVVGFEYVKTSDEIL